MQASRALSALAAIAAAACAAPAPSQGQTAPLGQSIADYIGFYEQSGAFNGVVLVARGDRIIYRESFGEADYALHTPLDPNARFRIASLSKQFTMAAIGRLADAGTLRLDDPLSRYLPGFPNAERITLRHLIDNESGVKHTNTVDWLDMTTPMPLAEIVDHLAREPLDFEPGTDSNYSNGGYALLAAVIERVTGQSFGDHVDTVFAQGAYPSVGHEDPFEVVPGAAHLYAPGPRIGSRVEATPYLVANRIGGGSLYANAEDVYRFFRATLRGEGFAPETAAALFGMPEDGDTLITGRSPGTLAQIYYDINDDLTVVVLSANSSWPGHLTSDIVSLARGETLDNETVAFSPAGPSAMELAAAVGDYQPERFRWSVSLEARGNRLVYRQDELEVAFEKTTAGDFYLPIWDWLCRFESDYQGFTCRQRARASQAAFVFRRAGAPAQGAN